MKDTEKTGSFWRAWRRFMFSPEWKVIRQRAIDAAGGKCQKCSKSHGLQAHHLHYNKPFGQETNEDLEVLCEGCHREEHGLKPLLSKIRKRRIRRDKMVYYSRLKLERKARIAAAKLL